MTGPRSTRDDERWWVKRHGITPEQYARIIAKVYESDLDWDNPSEYDLLDRYELTENAGRMLAALTASGYVIQSLDDLALDEFDVPARKHPEPEWEYGIKAEGDDEPWSDLSDDLDHLVDGATSFLQPGDALVRRTKAGPWVPVGEGERR